MKMPSLAFSAPPREPSRIGERLVKAGLLSSEDVDRILVYQREHSLRFGEAAVRMGLISATDMHFALSRQFDYAYLRTTDSNKHISEEVIAAYQPFSPRVDEMRAIRSQLMLRWLEKPHHHNVLAVVGAERNEGRSYLAANLAVVFSQAGANTLLIDADLRVPRQHELFGLDNQVGLSTLLAGHTTTEPIIRVSDMKGLFVMCAGPVPPNPLELLSRPAWGECLAKARGGFDLIIIDCPALSTGEDAVLTAVRAGAALAVARTDLTHLPTFIDMLRELSNSGVMMVGSVLNDVPPSKPAPDS